MRYGYLDMTPLTTGDSMVKAAQHVPQSAGLVRGYFERLREYHRAQGLDGFAAWAEAGTADAMVIEAKSTGNTQLASKAVTLYEEALAVPAFKGLGERFE